MHGQQQMCEVDEMEKKSIWCSNNFVLLTTLKESQHFSIPNSQMKRRYAVEISQDKSQCPLIHNSQKFLRSVFVHI